MSSASTPDFRATLRRQQQRRPNTLAHSSSMHGLSTQGKSVLSTSQPASTVATQPDTRSVDPTFEPLERAGRAINEGIRKDDRFPELDQLVQRIQMLVTGLIRRGSEQQLWTSGRCVLVSVSKDSNPHHPGCDICTIQQ